MFANSVRQGLRAASRQSVRGLATQSTRTAPRYGAAAAAAAVAGFALYQCMSPSSPQQEPITPLQQALQTPVPAAPAPVAASAEPAPVQEDKKPQETQAEAPATQTVKMEGQKTIAGEYKTETERSFIMVKPDGVSRGIFTKVLSRFEEKGYKIVAVKMITPSKELAREHYIDLKDRPFYPSLVEYITSGVPVVAFVIEGKEAIKMGRVMVGATNPLAAGPGSIRGDYAVSIGRNIVHASDSFESATKEIGLWFKPEEIANYKTAAWDWIMADN